jgi:hypothetical protein
MIEKDIKIIEKEGKKPLGVELSENCKFRQILIDEIFRVSKTWSPKNESVVRFQ